MIENTWRVAGNEIMMEEANNDQRIFHIAPYSIHVPTFGLWGFLLASRQPLDIDSLNVTVSSCINVNVNVTGITSELLQVRPLQLVSDVNTLRSMFVVPYDVTEDFDAGVNSETNLVLHDIYTQEQHIFS